MVRPLYFVGENMMANLIPPEMMDEISNDEIKFLIWLEKVKHKMPEDGGPSKEDLQRGIDIILRGFGI